MREGSSKRLALKLLACIVTLLASGSSLAQGGDGRTEFSALKSSRSKPKISKVSYRKPQKPVPPKPGTLVIAVDETASDIYLARVDGFSMAPQSITTDGPISRSLDPGAYQLRVRKYGYFDEMRNFDLLPGEYRKVDVTMRPQMAFLTVRTNLNDAEIDIENVGKFTKPLKQYSVMPGTYRITLRRRGYASQSVTADLSIAGKEQSIYAVLEPLRIDSVLWTATKEIEKGNLSAAADLVNDVLTLNRSHAKANLVRGFIELRRGSESASDYFLKAIDGSETVLLPMRVLHAGQLVDINVSIDREAISFANEKYLELNFRILRSELDEVSRSTDQDQTPFLTVRGKSDFYGKPIRPEMKLTLPFTTFRAKCTPDTACIDQLEVIYKSISTWRNRSRQ